MQTEIVLITQAARDYISHRCQTDMHVVLVKINNKGCSGHSYEYNVILANTAGKFDEMIRWDNGGIAIDSSSIMHLIGSTLDVKTSIMESYLYWENPKAIDHCGCGTSFALST